MAADPSTCSVLAPFMQTKEQVNCEVDAKSFIVNEVSSDIRETEY